MKAIVKYRNYPSIKAVKRVSNSTDLFSFDILDREKILKEINSLDYTKHVRNQIHPQKLSKRMLTFFEKFLIS